MRKGLSVGVSAKIQLQLTWLSHLYSKLFSSQNPRLHDFW